MKLISHLKLIIGVYSILLFVMWIAQASAFANSLARVVPSHAYPQPNALVIESSTTMTSTVSSVFLPMVKKSAIQGQGILFVSDRVTFEKYDLYVMNSDGSDVTRLTDLGIDSYGSFRHQFMPRWSPDGTRVAFQVDGQIYVMNPDGSGQRPLLDDLNMAAFGIPEWSPDGHKLAFHLLLCREPRPDCLGGTSSVRTLDLRTMEMDVIFTSQEFGSRLQWSTDGKSLFAPSIDGGWLIGNMDDSSVTRVVGRAIESYFEVSPDDQQIAYVSGSDVYVADIDGSDETRVYDSFGTDSTGVAFDVVWRPDGQKIAYATSNPSLNHSIYIVNPDGSNRVELTDYDNQSRKRLLGWTADGSQFIYSSDVGQAVWWIEDIYIVNEDGSNLVNLTPNTSSDDSAADYYVIGD